MYIACSVTDVLLGALALLNAVELVFILRAWGESQQGYSTVCIDLAAHLCPLELIVHRVCSRTL